MLRKLTIDIFSVIILIIFFIAFIPLFQQIGWGGGFINVLVTGVVIILVLAIIYNLIDKLGRRKR